MKLLLLASSIHSSKNPRMPPSGDGSFSFCNLHRAFPFVPLSKMKHLDLNSGFQGHSHADDKYHFKLKITLITGIDTSRERHILQKVLCERCHEIIASTQNRGRKDASIQFHIKTAENLPSLRFIGPLPSGLRGRPRGRVRRCPNRPPFIC